MKSTQQTPVFTEQDMIQFGQWCVKAVGKSFLITPTHLDKWFYNKVTAGIDLPTDYILVKQPLDERDPVVQWQCLGCGQDTSNAKWLGCCSRECMKSWLETNPVNRAAGEI